MYGVGSRVAELGRRMRNVALESGADFNEAGLIANEVLLHILYDDLEETRCLIRRDDFSSDCCFAE